jgi:hypothetical protein
MSLFTSIQRITTDEELVWLAKVYDRLSVAIREPGRGWLDSEIDDALRGLPFACTWGLAIQHRRDTVD